MQDLLKKTYDKVLYYEQEYIESGKQLDEVVNNLVEQYKVELDEKEIEKLRDLIHTVSYTARYEGFKLVVKTVLQTLIEVSV